MGWFRPSREHRGPDPYQTWKAIIFGLGALFGLGGIAMGRDWMILSAIGILSIGVVLRFLPGARGRRDGGQDGDAGE